jgi:hypothetical protein
MRLLALGLVLTTMTVAVVPARAAERDFTGVEVQVVRLSAGEIVCIRAPCTLPSARVTVSVFTAGKVVARARTGSDGRVRIRLAPGVYAVRVPRLAPENRSSGRHVVVTRDSVTDVLLTQRSAPLPGNPR